MPFLCSNPPLAPPFHVEEKPNPAWKCLIREAWGVGHQALHLITSPQAMAMLLVRGAPLGGLPSGIFTCGNGGVATLC